MDIRNASSRFSELVHKFLSKAVQYAVQQRKEKLLKCPCLNTAVYVLENITENFSPSDAVDFPTYKIAIKNESEGFVAQAASDKKQ